MYILEFSGNYTFIICLCMLHHRWGYYSMHIGKWEYLRLNTNSNCKVWQTFITICRFSLFSRDNSTLLYVSDEFSQPAFHFLALFLHVCMFFCFFLVFSACSCCGAWLRSPGMVLRFCTGMWCGHFSWSMKPK